MYNILSIRDTKEEVGEIYHKEVEFKNEDKDLKALMTLFDLGDEFGEPKDQLFVTL